MIDLEIPEDARTFLEMVKWLGKEYFRPLGIEADRKKESVPADSPFYYKCAELGLQARTALEGGGASKKEKKGERTSARFGVLLGEESAYWDRGVAVSMPGPGLGGPPVNIMGTDDQKKRFLSIFQTREKPVWGAFGMTESGAGSDVARIATRCEKKGDRWVLNGDKAFCSNADRASWIIIWATVDRALKREGHRAFVVERGTPGLDVAKVEHKMGLSAYTSCSLFLDNCEVPAENLLGGEEYYTGRAGFKGAMKSFDATRPIIASMAVGIGRAAWDYMQEFVRQNYVLDRPVPRYRKIKEKIVTINRRLDVGRLLCWKAAWLADMEQANTLEASQAKAYCPPAALEAVSLCIDIMADAGVRNDYFVEKLFRDVKAIDLVEGTGQIQRVVIARRIADYPRDDA
ncbi:MAG: acyl-CoA dehydrogenase family protein [Deltaproteobacteria bacterium]|nr:acyl-CoA dehydrogenase family protein [Deltaproteobacteria bacterium]